VTSVGRDDTPSFTDVGEGETVVLLHGWPVGPSVFRRLAPLLATRFQVITPDLTGGGTIASHATAVGALLGSLGVERCAVIGHSHGGAVAQLLALDTAVVDVLVLLDSVAFDIEPPTDLSPRAFVERGSVEFATLPSADLDGYVAAPARDAPALADVLTSREPELSALTMPVFMLWGEDDIFVPLAVAERLNETIGGSTLGVVPDSGHFLLDDAFDSVGVLIAEYLRARFLGAPHGHEGIVMMQLERRPPGLDLSPLEADDDGEPITPDPRDQEVGPNP